jgi:hypothetical protein
VVLARNVLDFEIEEIDITDPTSHRRVREIRCLNHFCEEFRIGFEAEEDAPNPMAKVFKCSKDAIQLDLGLGIS